MVECLITGGAGFIGSNLAESLAGHGWRVRVLDDLSTGSRANLAPLGDRVELQVGDIRDGTAVRRAMAGVDRVFHLAALVSVAESVSHPERAEAVNVGGTLEVLRAAAEARVGRLVFASSAAVYGESPALPKDESQPTDPVSPYGITKLAGEHYLRFFARERGLPTVSLRFFNVFGPRQDPSSPYSAAIPRFLDALLAGRPPTVFGDGTQTRDFCPVADVVQACRRAAEAPAVGSGEAINVGRGEETRLLDLLRTLAAAVGAEPEPVFAAPRPGDLHRSVADIRRARSLLGFEPSPSLAQALEATARWYRERAA